MTLTDPELDRYARHIVLPDIGAAGQVRWREAHVALVGAGGIGSPAIQYLAAAGVGRLTLIDDDVVEESNLQRQTIFGDADIGVLKAQAASGALSRLNPYVTATVRAERLDAGNAASLIAGAEVVVDGSDSFETRLTVADACHAARIPLVSAAVSQFEGQLAVYRGWEPSLPCYRCFVGNDPAREGASCADVGVIGALAGVMGSLAALEALRAIHPFGDDPAGKLLLVDALSWRFRTIALPKDPGCRCAG